MHKLATPILKADLVYLEPLGIQHVSDDYVRWLNDPVINRFLEVRFFTPQTRETVLDYVKSFGGTIENYGWAMRACAGGAMIGTTTIPRVNRIHMTAGIGMMIGDRSYWGTSAAREALELVMEFAFDTLRLNRLAEHNVALNHQSNFMLRRAGFRHEGTVTQAYRVNAASDTYVDGFEFAMLAHEWRERRAARGAR